MVTGYFKITQDMTQKEISVINAINCSGIDNQIWGILCRTDSMDVRHLFGANQFRVVPPHIYVYRGKDDAFRVKVKGIEPDCTVEDETGEAIDLYFIEMEGCSSMSAYDGDYNFSNKFTGLCPCWVNAPSTIQPAHKWHGKNIVAVHETDGGFRCCCVDDIKPITFHLPENTELVPGWRNRRKEEIK